MTKTNPSDRIALITGAGRGLGRALALDFARAGLRVFAVAHSEGGLKALRALAEFEGLVVQTRTADHRLPDHNQEIADWVRFEAGGVDVVIHNAGVLGPRVLLEDYPTDAFDDVLAVNVRGPFDLQKRITPLLREGASVQLLSSGVGVVGRARWGAYCVSKWAVEGLGATLADELGERGVSVNVIDPGAMRTTMRAAAYPDEDPMTLLTPEENTGVFLWLANEAGPDAHGRRFKAKDWNAGER